MDKDEIYYLVIDLLKQLVGVKRVSREEESAASLFIDFFNRLPVDNYSIERIHNNIIINSQSFNPLLPTVLLNSHIDTVKAVDGWQTNPFEPIEDADGEKITGLGSNDAGASLVSLLGTFIYFLTNGGNRKYNLVFVASAEEEISGKNGFGAVLPYLPAIDFAIVGEPTGMNPAVAEKGLIVIDATVKGISGHAARDEGINAIYKAMPIISSLRSLRLPKESEWLGAVKISVTQINAGTQHNVVPDNCHFVIDVRTVDAYSNRETFEFIRNAMPNDCSLEPRSLRLNPSGISLENPVVSRFISLGRIPFGSPTLSDAVLMPWPTVKIGPGESDRSHTAGEFIKKSEIREALELYIAALS